MKTLSKLSWGIAALAGVCFSLGCSGSGASVGDDGAGGAGGSHGGNGSGGGAGGGLGGSASGSSGGSGGPSVAIHVVGSIAPVAHTDGFSGQTPSEETVGIRSLRLYRDANDKNPLVVFDRSNDPKEASLADEADTIVATVPASSLTAGTFSIARVGVSHVRYRVAATVHEGFAVPGQLETIQAMSDGAMIDGAARAKGYYESTFTSGATTYGPASGNHAVPKIESTGGISLDDSGSESAYVFPVNLVVDPKVTHDVKAIFTVNVHEDFRWQDLNQPGYAAGVFDTTTTDYEPVMSFGASAFALVLE